MKARAKRSGDGHYLPLEYTDGVSLIEYTNGKALFPQGSAHVAPQPERLPLSISAPTSILAARLSSQRLQLCLFDAMSLNLA